MGADFNAEAQREIRPSTLVAASMRKRKAGQRKITGINVSMPVLALVLITDLGSEKATALLGVQCGQDGQLLQ